MATALTMSTYHGKAMSDLCTSSLAKKNGENHCAHFVSHVLGYALSGSATCKNLTWNDKKDEAVIAASVRVNDIFNKCATKGVWSDKPATLSSCLMFVTLSTNIKNNKMSSHPRKHIGILNGGKIWNYSNNYNKVVADTPDAFIKKFDGAYKTTGAGVVYHYGKFLT